MRALVIGSGAREHALCWALRRSPQLSALYCAPGNGGTAQIAENVPLDPMNFAACAAWAASNHIDFTIIGPDDPLGAGIVDVFSERGLLVFGPTRVAARIEASKAWAKEIMAEAGVPTARHVRFTGYAAAEHYLTAHAATLSHAPIVVKADGLALGKGVVIAHSLAEARTALADMLQHRSLGEAGSVAILEDYLTGREVSVFALSDGERVIPLSPACDYKRAFDGNKGPNTGGMGAYSPPEWVTPATVGEITERILMPTIIRMSERGAKFRGLLYAGLMLTDDGFKVIEFNARFGDPETQVVLPRLRGDLLELLLASAHGDLSHTAAPAWSDEVACGVVAVSDGYPGAYEKGKPITGLDALPEDLLVFHGGTRREPDGSLVTAGGRVLTLVGLGSTLRAARERVYAHIAQVRFEGARWRGDIGA
jgi:phosphoribosylamine---glycine ligase